MTTALFTLAVLGYPLLILVIARFLGFWRNNMPRIDYCNEPECVRTGKCSSGDCY